MINTEIAKAAELGTISLESSVDVDVFFGGPIGGYGFRRGNWKVKIDGKPYEFYGSVPHAMDIDDQRERLIDSVRRLISQHSIVKN